MVLGYEIETRCNFLATIQGLLLIKLLIDLIYFGTDRATLVFGKCILWEFLLKEYPYLNVFLNPDLFVHNLLWAILIIIELALMIIDDIIYWLVISYRHDIHHDTSFELGIVVGKVVLHVLALYLDGFLLYQNYIELVINFI